MHKGVRDPLCCQLLQSQSGPLFAFLRVLHPGVVLVIWNKCVPKHSRHSFKVSHHVEACMAGCYTVQLSKL
jgi:hypothetical protein